MKPLSRNRIYRAERLWFSLSQDTKAKEAVLGTDVYTFRCVSCLRSHVLLEARCSSAGVNYAAPWEMRRLCHSTKHGGIAILKLPLLNSVSL